MFLFGTDGAQSSAFLIFSLVESFTAGWVEWARVCLFISNSQSPVQVCVNMEVQLPVITDHTHAHVHIYKPVIYVL